MRLLIPPGRLVPSQFGKEAISRVPVQVPPILSSYHRALLLLFPSQIAEPEGYHRCSPLGVSCNDSIQRLSIFIEKLLEI